MTEQIECVGGPLDGQEWIYSGTEFKLPRRDRAVVDVTPFPYIGSLYLCGIHEQGHHIYRYDPTQSKYIYQGVEK